MKKTIILYLLIGIVSAGGLYLFRNANRQTVNSDGIDSITDIPNRNKLYVDSELGYLIRIPEGFKVEKEGIYSKRILPDTEVVGMGPANFIYISVVTPENKDISGEVYNYDPIQFEQLITLENIGDSVNLAEGGVSELGEYFTYTVVALEDIDQGKAKNFENTKPWEFPAGTTENRFIYGTAEKIYILGYYTGGDSVSEESRIDPRVAYEVIKSFEVSR